MYIVDGGYSDDGKKLLDHVQKHYDNPRYIDHVVLTHSDTDHASGLETVLNDYTVARLWMNRPWQHVDELMPKFKRYQDRDRLIARLKRDFPKVAELEEIANKEGITIKDVFRGETIGVFTVLSPLKEYVSGPDCGVRQDAGACGEGRGQAGRGRVGSSLGRRESQG